LKWALVNPGNILLVSLLAVFLLPAAAAGSTTANMQFDYNSSKTTSEDALGTTLTSKSSDFLQRYNVDFRQPVFPTLTLGLGYILEKNLNKSQTAAGDSKTTFIRMSPSADLGFRNPFVGATVSYNEVEAKTETTGTPSQTLLQENVNASFGLARRGNLPTLNAAYNQSHFFDKEHLTTDVITKGFFLTSMYHPLKQLDMRYSGSFSDTLNKLNTVETTDLTHTGRLNYNDDFLKKRLRVFSSYDITLTQQQSKISGPGTGEVTEAVLSFAGLSGSGPLGTDTPPEVPSLDSLISNPLLIDGITNAASGVNIGFSALVTEPRNMGLDLGSETELNSMNIWINQRLPGSISNSFSWDVYVSSDTAVLKQWTLLQTVAPAPFGAFDARFELRFANVSTRFIKVVARPLASPVPVPGVDVNNILVTEVQAIIIRPIQGSSTTTTRGTGQRFEVGASAKLANVPNLNYDVDYWRQKAAQKDTTVEMLTNRLSVNHRLSRVFTTSAMVLRTDSHETDGDHLNYNYSASVTATPLDTLKHSLRFTRSTEEVNDQKSETNSAYLTNNAIPYRGISLNLSLGQSDATFSTGQQTKSSTLTAGSTLSPHRTMTINLYYSDLRSRISGGANPDSSVVTQSSSASAAYSPFDTLYLFGSYLTSRTSSNTSAGSAPTSRTQNYTLSWSPLFSGDIWFSVTATQVLTSVDNGENDTVSPQLRWNVNSYMVIEAGYQLLTSKNNFIKSKTDVFFANLRVAL
jgi:hypothetical protein